LAYAALLLDEKQQVLNGMGRDGGNSLFNHKLLLGLCVTSAFALSCGRSTNFIYHQTEEIKYGHEYDHNLKELQGSNKVDILFVIDNSGSMPPHNANLAKNAGKFMDEFVKSSRLDWRVGMVSSDENQPAFLPLSGPDILDKTAKDPVNTFKAAVAKLSSAGGGGETPFATSIKQLTANPGFLRPNTTLGIIMITDAAEQSRMGVGGYPGDQFVKDVLALPAMKDSKLVVYGVLGTGEFGCQMTEENTEKYTGTPYEKAITLTDGHVYVLCKDFGQDLADLSKDLVTRIERPYIQLLDRPFLKSVQVIYKDVALAGGEKDKGGYWMYDYDLNRIVFHSLDFAPGENEFVTIKYDAHPIKPGEPNQQVEETKKLPTAVAR
jgi:hypothetical protein